ncbi:superinfection immunity protein [Listeria booriae]|uniref:Superinfection immunity protein n=1 Tax=Listeria booriae TaxID=1552123 RepID=A0A7X0XEQ1_9LIST|nr:superinfection immunity protein [Listeria booriae]MBC1228630.1 superinfection immunity protein [Listeria booriae]MBC1248102.1 superinfection immunity protein [Listeria booriae]MBC1287327.1 superinfection immunity protein [Listeria booriae]MBC1492727.1 superinfection immunity protein [Listeria booriae]MBC1899108.1 superinfection immunity protein [Listeria booriae]
MLAILFLFVPVLPLIAIGVYFLPTFLASGGNRGTVFLLNLFMGWTVLGWGMCFMIGSSAKK